MTTILFIFFGVAGYTLCLIVLSRHFYWHGRNVERIHRRMMGR